MKVREQVRAVFISDVHLGCRFCQAEPLLKFLRGVQPEYLYLVGDIIDGWKMRKKPLWTDSYSYIVRRIIGMMKAGTKVVYLAGNHDEFLRKFLPNTFGHLEFVEECVHTTADGRRLLIVHGDMFDFSMKATWLYTLGDTAYTASMWMNVVFNRIRRWFGKPYWSLSLMLKRKVKTAIAFVGKFEEFILRYTAERNCVGVICGHIHSPAIRDVDGMTYYNCGDWVESLTALVEHFDGQIELRTVTHPVPAEEPSGERETEEQDDDLAPGVRSQRELLAID